MWHCAECVSGKPSSVNWRKPVKNQALLIGSLWISTVSCSFISTNYVPETSCIVLSDSTCAVYDGKDHDVIDCKGYACMTPETHKKLFKASVGK